MPGPAPPLQPDAPNLALADVEARLRSNIELLLKAPDVDVPHLTKEIQRLRLARSLLTELEDRATDPTLLKELNSFARLSQAVAESETEREDSEAVQAAQDRLEKRGITAEGARRIARLLSTVVNSTPPDDDDDPMTEDDLPWRQKRPM